MTAATLTEDQLVFRIYPVAAHERSLHALERALERVRAHVSAASLRHVWQRDVLRVDVSAADVCLCGTVRVGDNIEDEWFAVHLLRAAVDECVATTHALAVSDNDGQFLLIEAAAALPAWLEPTTSENRLFRFARSWHLLDGERDASLPLDVALRQLADASLRNASLAPKAMAALIDARLARHPAAAVEHASFRVRCRVPRDVARALSAMPLLVALAVATFYLREPADIAAASRTRRFGSTDLVDVRVRFTRCLYAQLSQQRFFVPRGTHFVVPPESDADHRACQVGMQLAAAFEMMVARGGAEPADTKFCEAVAAIDSAKLIAAPGDAVASAIAAVYDPDDNAALSRIVDSVCGRADVSFVAAGTTPDDDDAWMTVLPTEVDALLESHLGALKDENLDVSDDDDDDDGDDDDEDDDDSGDRREPGLFDPRKMDGLMSSIQSFVERESSLLDGIENDADGPIQFDEQRFLGAFASVFEQFRRVVPPPGSDEAAELDEDKEYAAQMEAELSTTAMAHSFERASDAAHLQADELAPVDVNLNLVKNLLTSFAEQRGEAGPASSMVSQLLPSTRPHHAQ
jgi:hypothetical protein